MSITQEFTREELARCNGKDGAPAYIAYEGRVYDVSPSFLWQRGRHQVRHLAGLDYTGGLRNAPHGPEMFDRLSLVGILVESC
jgi:predicted heme/steroid binding protein